MKRASISVFCGLLSFATSAHAETATCAVETVRGESATLWRNGRSSPVRETVDLAREDRIETGANTIVTVTCRDDMRMTIGPETSIDLGRMGAGKEGWATFLLKGIAGFARSVFGGSRFEVRTPSAVASVRSTEWIVTVTAKGTAVFVDEGAVSVNARTGGAVLQIGEGVDVTVDGAIGPVKTWGAARVRKTREQLGFGTE